MSETPPEFDLKFLPDWLKESAPAPKYADYDGPTNYDRPARRGPGGDRGARPSGGRGPGGPGGPGGARDSRGPRPGGPSGPGGQNRGPRPDRGPGGDRGRGPRPARPDDRRGPSRDERDRPPRLTPPPAQVKIEFLPDPNGALSIAKQIKQSGRAYPLFGTGRLFLERPERHRVRITSLDPNVPLHQIEDGPVSFEREAVERTAFVSVRSEYYKEEIVEGEPIKGNYANVARLRSSGAFLGPTNYHSYQPALRRIYEERYARRMSFPEFVQTEVQVVSDEQAIADWKEQARSSTTYVTLKEPEPIVFKTVPEVEQHFRKTYLPQIMKSGTSLECSGQASRSLPDRSISFAVRDAWEQERGFPVQVVNHLRPFLLEAGLHFFKHRKRILYISAIKPVRHVTGQALSSGIESILSTIEAMPRCTRRDLAVKVLGENADAPELAEQKSSLARDLHYLVHAGHVLEFHDGALDLPLIPVGAGNAPRGEQGDIEREAERAVLAETGRREPTGKRTEPPPRRVHPPYVSREAAAAQAKPAPGSPAAETATEAAPTAPDAASAGEGESSSLIGAASESAGMPVQNIEGSSQEILSSAEELVHAPGDFPPAETITTTEDSPTLSNLEGFAGTQPSISDAGGYVAEPALEGHTALAEEFSTQAAQGLEQEIPVTSFVSDEATPAEAPVLIDLGAAQGENSAEVPLPPSTEP